MKKSISLKIVTVAVLGALGAISVQAQSTDATKLLKELEDSGALEQAFDRIVTKKRLEAQKAQEQQQAAEMKRRNEMAKLARAVDPSKDMVYGPAKSTYSVIVYSDLECPYCQRFADTAERSVSKLPNTNVVLRHLPLTSIHPNAFYLASVAQCAGNELKGGEKYFELFNAMLVSTQNNRNTPKDEKVLKPILAKYSLDYQKMDSCANSEKMKKFIEAELADAQKAGLQGTPAVLIRNNKTGATEVVGGAVPGDVITKALQNMAMSGK